MRRYSKIILLIMCFGCFYHNNLKAQDEYAEDSIGVLQETPVGDDNGSYEETGVKEGSHNTHQRLYMDEFKLEQLRKKKEFQYPDRDSVKDEEDTYISRPSKTEEPVEVSAPPFDGSIIIWLVVIAAVIVIILQLLGVNMRQLFTPGKILSKPNNDETENENIHEIPYESAIQQAILSKNYSLATRLMYLQSLKLLSDKNLISWHENKTNWQYVFELKNDRLRNSFRTITYIFEYVRYGHMPISEEKFVTVKESFSNFKMNVI